VSAEGDDDTGSPARLEAPERKSLTD